MNKNVKFPIKQAMEHKDSELLGLHYNKVLMAHGGHLLELANLGRAVCSASHSFQCTKDQNTQSKIDS